MHIVKKLFLCMMVFCMATMFFSCKKESNVKSEADNKLYVITNPSTQSVSVFDKNGNVILKTLKPREEYLRIIKDEYTQKDFLLEKTIIGENKIQETYVYDGTEYHYDNPSHRVVLYDLNGQELTVDKQITYGIEFALNNKIIFSDDEKKIVYDLITKDEKVFKNKQMGNYKDKFIVSDHLWDEKDDIKNVVTEIYDKDLNLIKKIIGYDYEYVSDIGKKQYLHLGTKKNVKDDMMYHNYLDENLDFVFDDPIENNVYKEETSIAECKRGGYKFKFDFEKKEIVGDMEIDTDIDSTKTYSPEKYDEEQKAIEEKFKDIDENATWYDFEKNGKKYFYNQYDKNYNQKETFELYDTDKNKKLDNILEISTYFTNDNIMVDRVDGTQIYDNDIKLVKDFNGLHLDIYSLTSNNITDKTKYYCFKYKNEDKMGILNDKYDIIIDNLKYAGMLENDYFTYMKGFNYGLMDYKGNVLYSFSIFDDIKDEEEIVTSNDDYDYMEETKKIEIPDKNNYPIVDGSTANMPMMAEIRSRYLKEDKIESEDSVKVTTTDYAWRNLIEGKNDLLLVYEPSAETKKIIDDSGVKLKITPIGVDALVFINNENNPIKNINTSELKSIYSGKITNWKEIGGEDKKIEAFQRPLNSGSQTLFLKLLMKDTKAIDAPKSYRPQAMDDLIEVLATYNNDASALGYSVYYYAQKMYNVPGLKLLSVDGIEPNDDTISSGEYPFLNEYYLVIREDTDENSETMKLYNFILSEEGKKAIKDAGYIPR